MKKLLEVGIPKNRSFYLGVLSSALYGVSSVALLATSAYLISRAAQMPPILYLMVAVVGVRAFALGRASFRYAERLLLHDATFRKLTELRPALFRALVPLIPAGFKDHDQAQQLDRITSDVDETQNLVTRVISPIAAAIAGLLLATAIAWTLVIEAALTLFVSAVFLGVANFWLTTKLASKAETQRVLARANLRSALVSNIDGLTEFELNGWSEQLSRKVRAIGESQYRADKSLALASGIGPALFSLAGALVALSLAVIGQAALSQGLAGEFLAVLVLTPIAVFELLAGLQQAAIAWQKYRISAQRISGQLSLDLPKELQIKTGSSELDKFSSLELQNISIRYPNAEIDAVSQVSFKIKRGELVALMAPSGSGKTTIGYLIARLLNQQSGEYLINGKPVASYSLDSIRNKFGLVEQQPRIFAGSLRQNLEISGVTEERELISMLEQVGLWKLFAGREGLETQLGQAGLLISGGEAQRVAIARALLAGFEFLVIDEPTSALDKKNAEKLMSDISKLCNEHNLTALVITHDKNLTRFVARTIEL